jgi:hypothetical protein
MAIGNPISSQNNFRTIDVTATAGQTLFTIADGYEIHKISVFRNGVRLTNGTDYTAADASTVTLNVGCQAGDEVSFVLNDVFAVPDAIVSAASSQTISGDLVVTGTLYASVDGIGEVGIQSGGTTIGITSTLNFTGAGNTVTLKGDGSIDIAISGGARGGGPDKVFQENQRVVTTNYQLTSGYSAVSVGPVSVSAGVTVTIPGSERWVIL